jgi:nucleoid DNA-binding protein|nr:MAG TPA: Bacterial nucleoid DNA-binding protein [Caudoviricetes sp.]
MKALTQAETIEKLAEVNNTSKAEAANAWKGFIAFLKGQLDEGNNIRLGELGVLTKKIRPAGVARVPGTGETVEVPARYTYKLKKRPQDM